MAGSNYKLLIEARLDPAQVQAQIAALSAKNQMLINVKFNTGDLANLKAQLDQIEAAGNKLTKITIFGDKTGGIKQAAVEYLNVNKNLVKTTLDVNKGVIVQQQTIQNIAKDEAAIVKIEEQRAALLAKQADEMAAMQLTARKFLARSGSMDVTNPRVAAAVATAQGMVSETDINKLREMNNQLAIQKSALVANRTAFDSWIFGMKNAIKQTIEYAISVGLIYGALAQLREGIKFVADLNKELVSIQVLQTEGAKTSEEIAQLAVNFNDLGRAMGATTIEIAKGSVEWLRQGYTIADTQKLLTSTLMLSKLGNMETADSTEKLISTLNGFGMAADDATTIVSKLIAIDNIAATSAQELSTALQYSSAVANNVGVSFDQLNAMVGTVSSVTRLSAETIGQAFKTIFTRMEQVKAGAKLDEFGDSLNNVETVLTKVNIKLRDSATSFRPLGEVIDEIGAKWSTFNDVQRNQIATAVAGVRQGQIFLTLMQHYGDVAKYITAETNSAGLAQDRYAIYLKGVEAAQNRLTASWERLWMETVKSGGITWFLNLAASILDVISAGTGLVPVLTTIMGILIVIKSSAIAGFFVNIGNAIAAAILPTNMFAAGLDTVAVSAQVAGLSLNAMLGIVGLVIAAISIAFIAIKNHADAATHALEKLNQAIQESDDKIASLRNKFSSISELTTKYKDLEEQYKKTNVRSQEHLDVMNQLHDLVPSLVGTYDDYGNFILTAGQNMDNLNDETKLQIELTEKLRQAKIDESAQLTLDALLAAKTKKESADRGYLIEGGGPQGRRRGRTLTPVEIAQANLDYQKALDDAKVAVSRMSPDVAQSFRAGLKGTGLAAIFANEFSGKLDDFTPAKEAAAETTQAAFESFSKTFQSLADTSNVVDDLISKSNKGTLSTGDIAKAAEYGAEALINENGVLKINIDFIKQKQLADAEMSLESIKAAEARGQATAQEVSAVEVYYNGLLAQSRATFGQFNQTAYDYDALLWRIANDAVAAGFQFQTMDQVALKSAQDIFDYMAKGDAQFNYVIEQIAKQTGRSVADVMQQVNLMINQTAANAYAALLTVSNANATLLSIPGAAAYLRSKSGTITPVPSPVNLFQGYTPPAYAGGGGGGGGPSPEQTRIENETKALEDKKKALQDNIDEYKNYIDSQKQILKLQQEEKKFTEDMMQKEKDLAKIKAQIAILALDDSEEAKAQRLKLEEDAANKEQDITKASEDRKYELQIEALDKAQKDYEDKIKEQMKLLDDKINKLQDEKSQLDKNTGAVGGMTSAMTQYGSTANQIYSQIKADLLEQINLTQDQKTYIQGVIDKLHEENATAKELANTYYYMVELLTWLNQAKAGGAPIGSPENPYGTTYHEGGPVIESHHQGDFAGSLKSNEVFAKLIKGEYVATENDMRDFVKNILPRMMTHPEITRNVSSGDIHVEMPITVAGNLDKTVIPDLEKITDKVIVKLNDAMKRRGHMRSTSLTSI